MTCDFSCSWVMIAALPAADMLTWQFSDNSARRTSTWISTIRFDLAATNCAQWHHKTYFKSVTFTSLRASTHSHVLRYFQTITYCLFNDVVRDIFWSSLKLWDSISGVPSELWILMNCCHTFSFYYFMYNKMHFRQLQSESSASKNVELNTLFIKRQISWLEFVMSITELYQFAKILRRLEY